MEDCRKLYFEMKENVFEKSDTMSHATELVELLKIKFGGRGQTDRIDPEFNCNTCSKVSMVPFLFSFGRISAGIRSIILSIYYAHRKNECTHSMLKSYDAKILCQCTCLAHIK